MPARLTPEERLDRAMTEKKLQQRVLYRARRDGWRIMHVPVGGAGRSAADDGPQWRSQGGSGKGFPDLVLARPPVLLFVELKRELGILSPEQEEWLAALDACGQRVYVWRPSDLRLGAIDGILKDPA